MSPKLEAARIDLGEVSRDLVVAAGELGTIFENLSGCSVSSHTQERTLRRTLRALTDATSRLLRITLAVQAAANRIALASEVS